MTHTPHELREDFPEFEDKIHTLKLTDNHFVNLADQYHDINREIHHIEIGDEHVSATHNEELRKKRMILKDKIYNYLSKE